MPRDTADTAHFQPDHHATTAVPQLQEARRTLLFLARAGGDATRQVARRLLDRLDGVDDELRAALVQDGLL